MTHTIQYFQPRQGYRNGYIVVDNQIRRSNGRLDKSGTTVGAYGFCYTPEPTEILTIYVECTRLDHGELLFTLVYINERGHAVGEINISSELNSQSIDIKEFVETL